MIQDIELEKVVSGPSLAKEKEAKGEITHDERNGTGAKLSGTSKC